MHSMRKKYNSYGLSRLKFFFLPSMTSILLSRECLCGFACDFHVLWCISWSFVLSFFPSIPRSLYCVFSILLSSFLLITCHLTHSNILFFFFLFVSSRKTSCCWIGACLTHALSSSTSAWHTRLTLATILKTSLALQSLSVSLLSNWVELQFPLCPIFP